MQTQEMVNMTSIASKYVYTVIPKQSPHHLTRTHLNQYWVVFIAEEKWNKEKILTDEWIDDTPAYILPEQWMVSDPISQKRRVTTDRRMDLDEFIDILESIGFKPSESLNNRVDGVSSLNSPRTLLRQKLQTATHSKAVKVRKKI